MVLGFIVGIVLFAPLLVLNFVQTLMLLIKPVSPGLFRRVNTFLAGAWWGWCVRVSRFIGVKVNFTGDPVQHSENAIVIANHQTATDVVMIMFLGFGKGRLGDLKWFVKDVMKYVPGIGWGMLFIDCLFVKRNWLEDKNSIFHTFEKFTALKLPFWLITFPEGTRCTPVKLKASQEYARQKGLPHFNHLLLPRVKGFTATVMGLANDAKAVYDLTIGYRGNVPSLWQYMQGRAKEIDVHVRRFTMDQIPGTEAEIGNWLINRFAIKDRLVDQYLKTHVFSEN